MCRLSTAGLLAVLGILNRQWYFCFLLLLMLDIFSHWFQMYATLAAGADTHKVSFKLAFLGFIAALRLTLPLDSVMEKVTQILLFSHF